MENLNDWVDILTEEEIPQKEIEDVVADDSVIMKYSKHNFVKKDHKAIGRLGINEFIILDTETTGISKRDEVIEIGAIHVRDGEIVNKFHHYIIPTIRISKGAQDVHGLSLAFLKKNGKDASAVFYELLKFIHRLPIVCHNVPFDKRLLDQHSKKIGMKLELNAGFDTLDLSRKMLSDVPSNKLTDLIDLFDLRKGLNSHSAMDDVMATFRLWKVLKKAAKMRNALNE